MSHGMLDYANLAEFKDLFRNNDHVLSMFVHDFFGPVEENPVFLTVTSFDEWEGVTFHGGNFRVHRHFDWGWFDTIDVVDGEFFCKYENGNVVVFWSAEVK